MKNMLAIGENEPIGDAGVLGSPASEQRIRFYEDEQSARIGLMLLGGTALVAAGFITAYRTRTTRQAN